MTSTTPTGTVHAPRGVLVDLGPIAQLRAGRLARRLPQLYVGLVLYGVSLAMMVRGDLGLAPWDVLHSGLHPPRPDDPRPGGRADQLRGAGALDPAAGDAGARHDLQRDRRRPLRRRDAGGASTSPDGAGGCGSALMVGGVAALRAGQRALHRRPARPRAARRPDDRPAPAHRALAAAGPHRPRGRRGASSACCSAASLGVGTVLYALAIGPLTQLMLPWFTVDVMGPDAD